MDGAQGPVHGYRKDTQNDARPATPAPSETQAHRNRGRDAIQSHTPETQNPRSDHIATSFHAAQARTNPGASSSAGVAAWMSSRNSPALFRMSSIRSFPSSSSTTTRTMPLML